MTLITVRPGYSNDPTLPRWTPDAPLAALAAMSGAAILLDCQDIGLPAGCSRITGGGASDPVTAFGIQNIADGRKFIPQVNPAGYIANSAPFLLQSFRGRFLRFGPLDGVERRFDNGSLVHDAGAALLPLGSYTSVEIVRASPGDPGSLETSTGGPILGSMATSGPGAGSVFELADGDGRFNVLHGSNSSTELEAQSAAGLDNSAWHAVVRGYDYGLAKYWMTVDGVAVSGNLTVTKPWTTVPLQAVIGGTLGGQSKGSFDLGGLFLLRDVCAFTPGRSAVLAAINDWATRTKTLLSI